MMDYITVNVNISASDSILARKWCIENNIKYAFTGHTYEQVVEYDTRLDGALIGITTYMSNPGKPLDMGFQFSTIEDAIAFKLRWS